jgi:2-C-methyl-D-erythritol 4-phosphate cytidylyltransferase
MDSKSPPIHFVIPCAGVGARSGRDKPKQYVDLAGEPMIAHTLGAILQVESVQTICLVVSPSDAYIDDILLNHIKRHQEKIFVVRRGGDTRAQSVLAGLEHLRSAGVSNNAWVLVHDAARCLITPELINHLINTCSADAVGGLLAIPVSDTLKQERSGRVQSTLTREHKWAAQTPQMFKLAILSQALEQGLQSDSWTITDESSAIETLGLQPILALGHSTNLKITFAEDFELAQALLMARSQKIDT